MPVLESVRSLQRDNLHWQITQIFRVYDQKAPYKKCLICKTDGGDLVPVLESVRSHLKPIND